MRHEYERSSVAEPETLADLRLVPMLSHPVRLEIAVQFCEGPRKVGFFSRAGDAALRVTDHRLFAIDGVSQRPQREKNGCRIAAGIGNQPCVLQLAIAPLGQAINGFIEQRRPLMGEAVPRRIKSRIVEAKGTGKIDDPQSVIDQLRRELNRGFVWRCQEDHIGLRVQKRIERERLGDQIGKGRIRGRGCAA